MNEELVRSILELLFHIPPKGCEHVLRPGDDLAVQSHRRHRIKPLGHQLHHFFRQLRRRHLELRPVFPVAFLNPLKLQFVGPEKWIREQSITTQIQMHTAGHLRR